MPVRTLVPLTVKLETPDERMTEPSVITSELITKAFSIFKVALGAILTTPADELPNVPVPLTVTDPLLIVVPPM